jgi:chromosome partitioning protein
MIKFVVLNQRGGVGKTTTSLNLARYLADSGKRTLLVDADPQGSIDTILRLRPQHHLYEFLIDRFAIEDCVVTPNKHLDILCGNRNTANAETKLMGEFARERILSDLFELYDSRYDAVVIDVAPSVSLMQSCAMVYAQNVLIPVDTDYVSLSGAAACIQFIDTLSKAVRTPIKAIGLLPTKVDKRLGMTKMIRELLEELSKRFDVPILQEIRTDTAVAKAARQKQFLVDFDPKCKAYEDYTKAAEQLLELFEGKLRSDVQTVEQAS